MGWSCTGCGRSPRGEAYSVIDVLARPDLVRAAVDGKLNGLRCPTCGTPQTAELPLLVYNGAGYPHVYSFYPSRTTPQQDQENHRALLEMLLGRMGPVTAEKAEDSPVLSLPREMVPMILAPLIDAGDGEVSGTFPVKGGSQVHPPAEVLDVIAKIAELQTAPLGRSVTDEPHARELVRLAQHGLELVSKRNDPELRAVFRLERAKGLSVSHEGDNPLANLELVIGELLRARADLPADRHPELRATIQFELGRSYQRRLIGDPVRNLAIAEDHLRSALEAARQQAGYLWAAAQSALGSVLIERGTQLDTEDVEDSIRLLEDVVARLDVTEARELWCDAVSHLAAAYGIRADGDRAVNLERALELYERLEPVESVQTDPEQWANTQVRVAVLLMKRLRGKKAENSRRARVHLLAALKIYEEVADVGEASSTRDKLALVAEDLDDHEDALRWLKATLEDRPREVVPRLWARTQLKLGSLMLDHPEAAREGTAAQMRRRGLRMLEEAVEAYDGLPGSIERGLARRTLARSYRRYRRHLGPESAESADLLAREVAEAQAALEELRHRPDMAGNASAALGDALADAKDWVKAAEAFQAAVDVADEQYRACLLRTSREHQLTGLGDLHQRAAYALARAGRPTDAVLCLERGQARVFGEELSPDRDQLRRAAATDAEAGIAYERAADALWLLHSQSWELTRLGTGGGDRQVEAREAALAGAIEGARADLRAAVARVRKLPGMNSFLTDLTPADLAGAAELGDPICYLAATEWGSVCLSLPASPDADQEPVVTWPDLTLDEAKDCAQRLTADPRSVNRELPALLARLGERLMSTVVDGLGSQQAVVLVPCGVLGHLPLHAAAADSGQNPLLAGHAVAYAPSLRMLLAARRRLSDAAPAMLVTACGPDEGLLTREETGLLGAMFEATGGRHHVARDADDLLAALPAATYVHLAGHGDFDPDDPLASGVEVGNGRITLSQLLDVGVRPLWNARLVTLSACRTAVIDGKLPDEAIGLPAGILLAGGAGVVCTLWDAHDIPALLVMTDLYRRVLGADDLPPTAPRAALRDTQRWLATARVQELLDLSWLPASARKRLSASGVPEQPFRLPYFWAPFVLVGV